MQPRVFSVKTMARTFFVVWQIPWKIIATTKVSRILESTLGPFTTSKTLQRKLFVNGCSSKPNFLTLLSMILIQKICFLQPCNSLYAGRHWTCRCWIYFLGTDPKLGLCSFKNVEGAKGCRLILIISPFRSLEMGRKHFLNYNSH